MLGLRQPARQLQPPAAAIRNWNRLASIQKKRDIARHYRAFFVGFSVKLHGDILDLAFLYAINAGHPLRQSGPADAPHLQAQASQLLRQLLELLAALSDDAGADAGRLIEPPRSCGRPCHAALAGSGPHCSGFVCFPQRACSAGSGLRGLSAVARRGQPAPPTGFTRKRVATVAEQPT